MSLSHDSVVDKIEYQYNCRAVQSEEKGLFYLEDDERKLIGILTIKNNKQSICLLNKNQVKALLKELKDVCDLYWGRKY